MDIEAEGIAFERRAVHVGNFADAIADDAGGVVQRVGLREAAAGIEVVAQQGDDGLADGEAAADQDNEDAFSGLHELMHFAAGVDLIEAGIGAGIGSQNQALIGHDAQAVGHDMASEERQASRVADGGDRKFMMG